MWGWPLADSRAAFADIGDRVIEAVRQLRRVSPRLQASIYGCDGRILTPAQVEALEVLDTQERWRMHQVAAKLGIDRSTATRTLAPLVEMGLVERSPDPLDARYVVVRTTVAGRRRSALISEARRTLMREVLGQMEPARRRLFAELLDEYVRAHASAANSLAGVGRQAATR